MQRSDVTNGKEETTMNNHPVLMTFAKGAAFALGYWGMKLALTKTNDWLKNPDKEPFIKIDIRMGKNNASDKE